MFIYIYSFPPIKDSAWFTVTLMRTSEIAGIPGGMSRVCKTVMQSFFGCGEGVEHDFRNGIDMDLLGNP